MIAEATIMATIFGFVCWDIGAIGIRVRRTIASGDAHGRPLSFYLLCAKDENPQKG
jgi:hypothetical protein